jgi:hypothetical protein
MVFIRRWNSSYLVALPGLLSLVPLVEALVHHFQFIIIRKESRLLLDIIVEFVRKPHRRP